MDLKESKNNTGSRHPWEESRFIISQHLLGNNKLQNNKFLDLCSGDLFFSKEYCAKNASATGYAVDIAFSNELMEEINKDKSINLSAFNSLDKLEEELKEPVSVVFLMDVLEHIEDDRAFLQDLLERSIVSRTTIFFVTVPAFQSLFCSHDVFLEHYRRYNNKQLKAVLNDSGLTMDKIGYFYTSLVIPRLIKVFKEKVSKNTNTDYSQLNHWNHGRLVTSIVRNCLLLDYRISGFLRKLGIKLPGLSNYAICKISA